MAPPGRARQSGRQRGDRAPRTRPAAGGAPRPGSVAVGRSAGAPVQREEGARRSRRGGGGLGERLLHVTFVRSPCPPPLWRAVDHEGGVLDVLVQRRRVKRAARKLTREPRRDQGFPPAVVTAGKPRSYRATFAEPGCTERHGRSLPRLRPALPVDAPRCLRHPRHEAPPDLPRRAAHLRGGSASARGPPEARGFRAPARPPRRGLRDVSANPAPDRDHQRGKPRPLRPGPKWRPSQGWRGRAASSPVPVTASPPPGARAWTSPGSAPGSHAACSPRRAVCGRPGGRWRS